MRNLATACLYIFSVVKQMTCRLWLEYPTCRVTGIDHESWPLRRYLTQTVTSRPLSKSLTIYSKLYSPISSSWRSPRPTYSRLRISSRHGLDPVLSPLTVALLNVHVLAWLPKKLQVAKASGPTQMPHAAACESQWTTARLLRRVSSPPRRLFFSSLCLLGNGA